MEKFDEVKEKLVGLLMFLKNGHFWMSCSSKGHSDASVFSPLKKKSIASFSQLSTKKKEEFA